MKSVRTQSVNRSALVRKLLTSREHGSIIAAATFGLPESAGGKRNWDYRYTWLGFDGLQGTEGTFNM